MSDQPEASRDFIEVKDAAEAKKLLWEGAKTLASAMIWTKDQSFVLNTHLSHYAESTQSFFCWIPKELSREDFELQVARSGQAGCYFSVSLQRANIFFKADFLMIDEAGLQFRWPEKIYKVQRRKDLRLTIPEGYILKIEMKDPLFPENTISRKVLDISAGGLAFLALETEGPQFQSDMVLKDVGFTVQARKIKLDAVVKHKRELKNDQRHKGFKVGVEYVNIRPGDAQHIAAYVFEESRKYFSRFL